MTRQFKTGKDCLLLILTLMLPAVAGAEVVQPSFEVQTRLHIREAPHMGAGIVGDLHRGESAIVLSTVLVDWIEIQVPGGARGYVSADWTRMVPESFAEATPLTLDD